MVIKRVEKMHSGTSKQFGKQSGFTMLELLTVLGMVGILVAIGVPAMSDWTQRAQVRSETQKYTSILSLARSTAITNNQVVTVEIGAEEADGSFDIDIFVDDGGEGNQGFSAGDTYVRQFEGEATRLVVSITPDVDFISFDENGRLMGVAGLEIDVQDEGGSIGRLIDINRVGRAAVSEKSI